VLFDFCNPLQKLGLLLFVVIIIAEVIIILTVIIVQKIEVLTIVKKMVISL